MNNKKEYLLSFLTDSSCFLNILSFSEFELKNNIINSYERISITTSSNVVNCFQMNDNIILFYLKSNFYYLDIYNYDLNLTSSEIQIEYVQATNLFFKGVHLVDNIIALIY